MNFETLIEKNKKAIVKKWFDAAVDTYQFDTSRFLKTRKDQFANPVGNTLSQGMASIFDELVKGLNQEAVISLLDPIIRIRAIQDFSPSRALSFILSLKHIIRDILKKSLKGNDALNRELILFEEKIDELLLIAFDIYMNCREKIYDLKANEEKSKIYKAFKRAGLIAEISEDEPDLMKSNV